MKLSRDSKGFVGVLVVIVLVGAILAGGFVIINRGGDDIESNNTTAQNTSAQNASETYSTDYFSIAVPEGWEIKDEVSSLRVLTLEDQAGNFFRVAVNPDTSPSGGYSAKWELALNGEAMGFTIKQEASECFSVPVSDPPVCPESMYELRLEMPREQNGHLTKLKDGNFYAFLAKNTKSADASDVDFAAFRTIIESFEVK